MRRDGGKTKRARCGDLVLIGERERARQGVLRATGIGESDASLCGGCGRTHDASSSSSVVHCSSAAILLCTCLGKAFRAIKLGGLAAQCPNDSSQARLMMQ